MTMIGMETSILTLDFSASGECHNHQGSLQEGDQTSADVD